MFINNFDPVAIEIFTFEIRWYSLAYITGILIGWILSKKVFITDEKIYQKFKVKINLVILIMFILINNFIVRQYFKIKYLFYFDFLSERFYYIKDVIPIKWTILSLCFSAVFVIRKKIFTPRITCV